MGFRAAVEIFVYAAGWMKVEGKSLEGGYHPQSRLGYRVSQFWISLRASPLNGRDLRLVQAVLTDSQMELFTHLQPGEQCHGSRVLQYLLDRGESHPDLLAAALLHDVGKICHPLRLWERVVIVLAKQLIPGCAAAWGRGEPKGWKRPFVISSMHASWGAEMVAETGASELLLMLIRDHQQNLPEQGDGSLERRLLVVLREADNQC
jgi:hypothetical protein